MSKFSVLVILVVMIASFQNCGKVQKTEVESGNNSSQTTYNKYSTSDYKVYSIWDYKRAQFLDVNLDNGEVKVFEEAGNSAGPTMWLKDEELAVAKATLASSEVCEPIISVPTGNEMCSQMYRYPYGILVNRGDEVRLGEMTSGCDKPVDLCGVKSEEMKQWSSHIVENLMNGSVTK